MKIRDMQAYVKRLIGDSPIPGQLGISSDAVYTKLGKGQIEQYVRKIYDFAEEPVKQVFYELIQNASDAEATNICFFYDKTQFLIINNGNPFESDLEEKGGRLKSFLTKNDNYKFNDDGSLGEHGQGSKLLYDLLLPIQYDNIQREDELLQTEILDKMGGLILASWNQNLLQDLLYWDNNNFQFEAYNSTEALLITKTIYTYYPSSIDEEIINKGGEKVKLFPKQELINASSFLKECIDKYNLNTSDFCIKGGTFIYLKLGSDKHQKLNDAFNDSVKSNIELALPIIPHVERITINDWNYKGEQKIIGKTLFLGKKNAKGKEYEATFFYADPGIFNSETTPNFFEYFPVTKAIYGLKFLINSKAYITKNSRQIIDYSTDWNKDILNRISQKICEYYQELVDTRNFDQAIIFINCILATDKEKVKQELFIKKFFYDNIIEAIKTNLPTVQNGFKPLVSIVQNRSKLHIDLNTLGVQEKYWIHSGIIDEDEVLDVQHYSLQQLYYNTNDEKWKNWIFTISDEEYQILINEFEGITDIPFIKKSDGTLSSINGIKGDMKIIPYDSRSKMILPIIQSQNLLVSGEWFDIDYRITDGEFYERLNATVDVKILNHHQKWNYFQNYINHFDDLDKSVLSQKLELFSNSLGVLKPLNKLLGYDAPNTQTKLLESFKIKASEIDNKLTPYLMSLEDIWGNILESWNDVILQIRAKDYETIYTDLLSIYNLSEESKKKLLSSDITCIKDHKDNWIRPEDVFYTPKLKDLLDNEYSQLVTFIERITDYKMLSFDLLKKADIVKLFDLSNASLSNLKDKLKEESTNSYAVSAEELKLLKQVKGQGRFFNHFVIIENENQLYIKPNDSYIKQFYSTDDILNTFLSDQAKYQLLPQQLSDVFSPTENDNLQVEGETFAMELIEAFGGAKELINIIYKTGQKPINSYIDSTKRIDFHTNDEKENYLNEYEEKIIKLIVSNKREQEFKEKIFINNKKLKSFTYDEHISLEVNEKNFRFSLEELGETIENKGLSIIRDRLKGINTGNLFQQEQYPINDLIKEIQSAEKLDKYQLLFLLVIAKCKEYGKIDFSILNISEIKKTELLQLFYEKEITWFEKYLGGLFFEPSKYILCNRKELLLDEEVVPQWVTEWLFGVDDVEKKSFLKKIGLLYEKDVVIIIREKIRNNLKVEKADIFRQVATNKKHTDKLLKWANESFAQPLVRDNHYHSFWSIYNLIEIYAKEHKSLPDYLLMMTSNDKNTYKLKKWNELTNLAYLNRVNSTEQSIITQIINEYDYNLVFRGRIDDKKYVEVLKSKGISGQTLQKQYNIQNISEYPEWNSTFYQEWKKDPNNEKVTIRLIPESIEASFKLSSSDIELDKSESDIAIETKKSSKVILVNQNIEGKSILDLLQENKEELFEKDKNKLIELQQLALAESNEHQEITEILESTDLSNDELKKLIQRIDEKELDISSAIKRLDSDGEGGVDLGNLTKDEEERLKKSIKEVNQLLKELGSIEMLQNLLKNLDRIKKFLDEEDVESTPNAIIGHIGEVLIFEWLKKKGKSEHVSILLDNNGEYIKATYTPYDFKLEAASKSYLIDVKTTIKTIIQNAKSIPFYVTEKEYKEIMENNWDNYYIIRISLLDLGLDRIYEFIKAKNDYKDFPEALKKHHKYIEQECKIFLSDSKNVKMLEKCKRRFKVQIPKLNDDVPF